MPPAPFVFSSATPQGWYLPEAAYPYYVLALYANIDFTSPNGNPPVNEGSVQMYEKGPESVKFLPDETVKAKLASVKKLSEVSAKDYDAVYYIGSHGPVFDLAVDPGDIGLGDGFCQSGEIVSAVCHGLAALVGVTDAQGKSIFADKNVIGFSNVEEEILGTTKEIPFSTEDRIVSLGGKYTTTDKPYEPKVVVDGLLLTGQNPGSSSSSSPFGEEILKALRK
ncbi:ThiJ/PfpI [Mycena albidolilacea]|uniref:D-lactate dehydratase n=1 Tax=Mycena albidolilacea TaxID=1033008 RepID=A0AAD6ZBT3_9AGAR|nr:ThiJ/PfpI [Mycena albidolilacea]